MPVIEFVGSGRRDADNITAVPSRLVNCYREPVGDERFALKSVIGSVQFADTVPVGRALTTVDGMAYAAAGGFLHEITSGGGSAILGSIADDPETTVAGNGENVTISAGGQYWVYDGSSVLPITGGAFDAVGSVTYLGGYTVLTERDGFRFEWTDLADPTSRDALQVAGADGKDDPLLRGLAWGGNLYLFGTESIEVWYLTGLANQDAFAQLAGGVFNTGLKSSGLAVAFDAGIFFVGNDNVAYLMGGGQPQPVSNVSVSTALAQGSPTHCFYHEDEGHKLCVIRFSDRPSWVLNISTGEWHERASGNDLSPWGALATTRAYGLWLTIDAAGVIDRLSRVNADRGQTLRRVAVSRLFEVDGARFGVSLIEARGRTGFANIGRDAEVMLRLSRDGGVSWGPYKARSLGGLGEYGQRAVWRNQGQFRRLVVEFSVADATEAPIFADMRLDIA